MYYRDPSLFGNQPVVDRYVDTIATSFRVSRAELNVVWRKKVHFHDFSSLCVL